MSRLYKWPIGIWRLAIRNAPHLSTLHKRVNVTRTAELLFRLSLVFSAAICGLCIYQRTINMWAMKNLGDTFLTKDIGSRQILLGSFFRPSHEQNFNGKYAVVHFLADGRQEHPLYCFTTMADGRTMSSRAHVQRIHRGKRAANDICSWAGHIAECEVEVHTYKQMRIGISPRVEESVSITMENPPAERKRHDLVVCVAPMYIYTDWEIMLLGIETWLALGATKIIVPIQSASSATYAILKEYERQGLVLSRGIEESHVNCLFYVKHMTDLVVFTDIDDMFLPIDPLTVRPGGNLPLLRNLFAEHPQAGSLLFEHRDVQLLLPKEAASSIAQFNFDFLKNTKMKQNCQVWRMKTRVVVNASRVDSVNMHETGIHRFGYVQTRIPCRQGHFYHMRHSHGTVPSPTGIDMSNLRTMLNEKWSERISSTFANISSMPLVKSSTESFEDFDRCMGAINDEHWTMHVSRCLTPHVCFSRVKRDMACVAVDASYVFHRSGEGYILLPTNVTFGNSQQNCEAPVPDIVSGNHFFTP